MTIGSTTSRWEYDGNGSTDTFAFNNKIFADADLNVYVDGTLQTLDTDYTVSGAGDDNGSVVFTTAPADSTKVLIVRSLTDNQLTDLPVGGAFPAESVEDMSDRRTIISQQQQEEIDRCLKIPVTDATTAQAYDGGGLEIENIAQGDATTSAANVGQVNTLIASATLGTLSEAVAYTVDTLTELQGVATSGFSGGEVRYMKGRASAGDGGEGEFIWVTGDKSTEVAADEVTASGGDGGVFVAPTSDLTGASGAWVRQYGQAVSRTPQTNALWYGAVGDGSTDNAALTQVILDKGVDVIFPDGDYYFSQALAVWKVGTVIRGNGQSGAKWNVAEDSRVNFIFDDTISVPVITLGGRPNSGAQSSGFDNIEDVLIENIHIRPQTTSNTCSGILIDGSDTDATYGSTRGIARAIVLRNISAKYFNGIQYRIIGNVFDVKMHDCFGRQGFDTIYSVEAATVNVGTTTPGQIDCFACGFFGPDRGDAGVAADAWAATARNTKFWGGHLQGQNILEAGFKTDVYGTHIEGDQGAVNCTCVHIVGKSVALYPEQVSAGNNDPSVIGIKIGDGTSSQIDGYVGDIPLLREAGIGIQVTDGGPRGGYITVGGTDVIGTLLQDDRLDNDGAREFKFGPNGLCSDGLLDLSQETSIGAMLGGANSDLSTQARAVTYSLSDGVAQDIDILPSNRGNWLIAASVPANGGSQYLFSAMKRSAGAGSGTITTLASDTGSVTLAVDWPSSNRPRITATGGDVSVELYITGSGAI